MAHVIPDFKSKKAFKEAVANGEKVRLDPDYYIFAPPPVNGREFISGPAEYHRWYAEVELVNGVVVKVK